MQIDELYRAIDTIVPKAISDAYCSAYGYYDNSGLLVRIEGDVQKAIFSLDFSQGAVDLAIETGATLIVTHHPAIFGKIGSIRDDDLLGRKLISCISHGISVISMHLNLDCVSGGIDESLMLALGGKEPIVMEEVAGGAYGRVYDVEGGTLSDYVRFVSQNLQTERILSYGNNLVHRVASFCGAGVSESAIAFAKKQGADTIVSADWKHHLISGALEEGLNVIVLTHYASECYGFEQFKNKCQAILPIECIWHEDGLK